MQHCSIYIRTDKMRHLSSALAIRSINVLSNVSDIISSVYISDPNFYINCWQLIPNSTLITDTMPLSVLLITVNFLSFTGSSQTTYKRLPSERALSKHKTAAASRVNLFKYFEYSVNRQTVN